MSIDRREFLAGAAASAVAVGTGVDVLVAVFAGVVVGVGVRVAVCVGFTAHAPVAAETPALFADSRPALSMAETA